MKIVASLLLLCCCCCVGRRQISFCGHFSLFWHLPVWSRQWDRQSRQQGGGRRGDRPKMNVRNILMLHLTVVTLFGAGQLSVISAADFGKATKAGECSTHLSVSLPLSLSVFSPCIAATFFVVKQSWLSHFSAQFLNFHSRSRPELKQYCVNTGISICTTNNHHISANTRAGERERQREGEWSRIAVGGRMKISWPSFGTATNSNTHKRRKMTD